MYEDQANRRCPECGLILYKPVSECPRCHLRIDLVPPPPPPPPEAPMIQRVYEDQIIEKVPKERKNIKRLSIIILTIIIIACLIIALSYHFIIPRLELKVITQYRENSGLVINLDSKVENQGTLDIQFFIMNISIMNSENEEMARGDYNLTDLDAHSSHNFDNVYFFGDQYDKYHINVTIKFESEGKDYSETFHHTADKYMLIRFEDKFMKWGG